MSEGVKGIVVEGREVGAGVGEVAREAAEDAGFGGKADFVHAAGGEPGTKPCLEDAGSNVGFGASKDKGGLLEEAAGGGDTFAGRRGSRWGHFCGEGHKAGQISSYPPLTS